MRRIFNYTLFFLLSLTIVLVMPKTTVKADACSYKEQAALNKEAKNIKKSYEFIEDDPLNYHFKIYLTNITEDYGIKVTSTYNDRVYNYTYADTTDGVLTFDTLTASTPVRYSIAVTAASGNCVGKTLKQISVSTPAYNQYSTHYLCDVYPEFKYCAKFLDTSNLTNAKFNDSFNNYINEKNSKNKESKKFSILSLLTNKWTIIIFSVLVLSGLIVLFVYIKKRKGSKI